jgi:hypothetical protein
MTRVLILAAGSGTRWDNYRGTPKYRLLIENEVLIERTYKQFAKYTNDIVIVSNDPEYSFDGPVFYNPPVDENWKEIAKFWSSRPMWGLDKTVMVFADVYFTDEAVDKIMNDKADLSFYLRSQRSKITGKPWREIWGIGFNNNSIPILDKTIMSIIESNEEYPTGGWHLHKKLTINGDKFNTVEIDDWTEDFDFPKDIDIWERQRKRYGLFTGYIE